MLKQGQMQDSREGGGGQIAVKYSNGMHLCARMQRFVLFMTLGIPQKGDFLTPRTLPPCGSTPAVTLWQCLENNYKSTKLPVSVSCISELKGRWVLYYVTWDNSLSLQYTCTRLLKYSIVLSWTTWDPGISKRGCCSLILISPFGCSSARRHSPLSFCF